MTLRRRGLLMGTAGGLSASVLGRPALADTEPLRIGWLAALTGPSSAPAIGFDRGVRYAVDAINAAGGIKGRKIELVVRDTQGDPTKAVNAVQDMISRAKVHAIYGPTNSGEALATTAIMARAKMPNLHAGFVDSLIDPEKYPNAFRVAPSNSQINEAVSGYCLDILKLKDTGVIADTTGYGTKELGDYADAFKKRGGNVVYQAQIDATQPDVTPDMLRMKDAKAQVIAVWSVSTGMDARMFNTRAAMNWDVAFVGHPSLASGEIAGLVEKPANWEKVYCIGYKSVSYDAAGKLPARTQDLVDRLIKAKVEINDTLLWWIAGGIDAIELFAKGVEASGSTDGAGITAYLNSLSKYPGYYGDYTFTPTQHNGYPTEDVVMSAANSAKNGTFALAPGYT